MNRFSELVSVFHGQYLPEPDCFLAGYSALIHVYDLIVPLPEICCAIGPRHKRYEEGDWSIFTPRHKPPETLVGHLIFALKYEGVDLAVLSALFAVIDPKEIEAWITKDPVSRYSRRIWFLYEWLCEKELNLPEAKTGNFVDAINTKQQYAVTGERSSRHRVNNNLPGVRDFCPLVRCTEKLKTYVDLHLNLVINEKIKNTRKDILTRASAYLLLKDSSASFEIEQEKPEPERAARWGQAIGQAGLQVLSKEELVRLQNIVLENNRFITFGFRHEGGFIGSHNRLTGAPVPDHISARWQDIDHLLNGMIATSKKCKDLTLDPVILAAMIAFGFVFIHPFADGNGRIHRYLIHHVLTENNFIPKGVAFPISAIILERIDEYRHVLESYSHNCFPCIQWRPTDKGNVEVLNKTIDIYRYFDATKQAEFLYDCMYQAIEQSLPEELDYLEKYDEMKKAIKEQLNMPDTMISLLIRFLEQNDGALSKRARGNEFKALSINECDAIEKLYTSIFNKNNPT